MLTVLQNPKRDLGAVDLGRISDRVRELFRSFCAAFRFFPLVWFPWELVMCMACVCVCVCVSVCMWYV